MCTVVDAPRFVPTVTDVFFRSTTSHVVQPDAISDDALASERVRHLSTDVSESERVANDSCCGVSESVVTHGSPLSLVEDFKTPFAWTRASNQSHCFAQDGVFVLRIRTNIFRDPGAQTFTDVAFSSVASM